jgi:putative thioredoxin
LALGEQNYPKVKHLFDQLIEKYPENPLVILEAAYFLLKLNRLEEAEKISQTIGPQQKDYYSKAQSLQTFIHLKRLLGELGGSELDQLFRCGIQLTLAENYEEALPIFLEILRKNRQYQQDGARKVLVSLFHWLGMEHPLTKQYQQELTASLY